MSLRKPIGNFIKVQSGFAFKSVEFQQSGIPLIRISNIQSNKVVFENDIFILERKISDLFKVFRGDLLIAMSGATTGKTGIYNDSRLAYLNQRVGKFVNKDENQLHYSFLNYLTSFGAFQKELLIDAVGGAQPNISPKQIEEILVDIPDLAQQKKITTILSCVDACIDQTEGTIAKLQKIKTGLMQDLFTRGIDSSGKLRPTYEENPELYKSSPLGMIPKDWSCTELSKLATVNDGTHFTPNYLEHGVPFLRVTDIVNVKNGFSDLKFISREEHGLLIKRCKPEKGDILYSKNGTIGIPKLIDWDFEFSIFVSLALIKIISTDITNTFLELQLDTFLIWNQIKKRAKQGTVTNLHLEEIREFQIVIPPPSEQEAIVSKIRVIKDMLEREEETLAKFNAIKSGLMQDLLTGKIEVKVDKDE